MTSQDFYLGTHKAVWLERLTVPLFVSHRSLVGRHSLPRAQGGWALDSGGFSELRLYGGWQTGEREYVSAVRRYQQEIGGLRWAAPMDWMCEPFMLERTGFTVAEHQRRTVRNLLQLRELAPELPFAPVLQGWELADYLRCVDLYADAGIDLTQEPVVGVGSVCRRQATAEIEDILGTLAGLGLRLHGFGVKVRGLARYADHLASADSLAWSYDARRTAPLVGCRHRSCANCSRYALRWRRRVVRGLDQTQLRLPGLKIA